MAYHNALLAFAQWLENTPWGIAIRGSSWMFPFLEWIHLSGLSLGLATSVLVDLRLLGTGKGRPTAAELSENLFAWNWIGLAIAIFVGFLMFSSDATTYVSNAGFRWKLGFLTPLALIWHVIVQKKTSVWTQQEISSPIGKFAAWLELLLWISIVTASVYFLLTNAP
jgi:hypothetical protein